MRKSTLTEEEKKERAAKRRASLIEARKAMRKKRIQLVIDLNPDTDGEIIDYLNRPDVKKRTAVLAGLRLLMMVDQDKKEKP